MDETGTPSRDNPAPEDFDDQDEATSDQQGETAPAGADVEEGDTPKPDEK
jgi:hypothetical protein